MRTPRKPAARAPDLAARVTDLRREAAGAGAEADPFDEAMVAAVAGLAEAMRAQAAELEAVRGRTARLARRARG